jgi:hypothetical protein
MKDDKDNIQLSAVEDHDGILTIRGGGGRRDWNGIHCNGDVGARLHAQNVSNICQSDWDSRT